MWYKCSVVHIYLSFLRGKSREMEKWASLEGITCPCGFPSAGSRGLCCTRWGEAASPADAGRNSGEAVETVVLWLQDLSQGLRFRKHQVALPWSTLSGSERNPDFSGRRWWAKGLAAPVGAETIYPSSLCLPLGWGCLPSPTLNLYGPRTSMGGSFPAAGPSPGGPLVTDSQMFTELSERVYPTSFLNFLFFTREFKDCWLSYLGKGELKT